MNGAPASLLVFTLGAAQERERRRLLPARLGSFELAIHQRGLEAALEAGRECGCQIAISSPRPLALKAVVDHIPQRGRSFGERFRGSLRELQRRQPEAAFVVVGTDIPGLTPEHVRQALSALADDPAGVVIGPSPDGGFYLLAARRPLDRVLARVRWRRRDTMKTLLAALREAGRPVRLLPSLADLDRASDLQRWLRSKAELPDLWERLLATLRSLLAALRRPLIPLALGQAGPVLAALGTSRAPPA